MRADMQKDWQDEAWDEFIARHWELHPVLLPAPAWARFSDLSELFDIILASRGSERLVADRFWVAKNPHPRRLDDFAMVDLDLLGPSAFDGSLEGFFSRMHGRIFGINLHRLDRWQVELRQRLAEPVKRLSRVEGSETVRRWDIDCFLGTYRMTPFGVHRDRASVFSLCLHGERTYLTWPPDYPWPKEDLFVPDESRLKKHLHTAEQFRVRPGELFYWPSNRWHVVCSDGHPSVVVQFSAYFGPQQPVDQAGEHQEPTSG